MKIEEQEPIVNKHSTILISKNQFSYYQPVWHFVLLSIMTFGIYDVYWYYKNWKRIKKYKELKFSPVWRTIGLFIPILNLFLIYKAHVEYREFIKEKEINSEIYPGRIVLVIMISAALVRLPDPYWLLSFVGTIPLAMVQGVLNDLWRKLQVDCIHTNKLNGRQILLIVFGGILWLLVLLGMTLPE